ncbi:MAG: AAA family ATPase [Saprospiraceae bacterium]|nr:AAA family ATPase [Saprospiraceae bacterium]
MIEKLHIQNYRLFKDLKIEKLSQINLIGGKNNSGKTALLEALRILGANAHKLVINDIIANRGDFQLGDNSCYKSLFSFKSLPIDEMVNKLKINGITIEEFGPEVEFDDSYKNPLSDNFSPRNFTLESDKLIHNPIIGNVLYLPTSLDNVNDAKFWDKISLTPKEEDVISILKIIDNRIKIVRYDSGNAKVLLEGEPMPRLLKNLGEGVNRLFSLALALVNAQNKILLIDEFEVGLHHSIQKQLWKIIFEYAKKWDIQVFITTHSLDTVRSFAEVLDEYEGMGQYMRLQKSRLSGDIEAVVYDKKSLDISIEQNFETR